MVIFSCKLHKKDGSAQDDDTVHAYELATTHRRRYATKQALATVTTKKVPKGNTSTVAQILETMTVEK